MQGLRPDRAPRNRRMASDPAPPGSINGNPQPNSWPPGHWRADTIAVRDVQLARRQIEPVLRERDAERPCQIARATADSELIHVATGVRPSPQHQLEPLDRLERANQHRGGT